MSRRRSLAAAALATLFAAPLPVLAEDARMAISPQQGPPVIPIEKTREEGVYSGTLSGNLSARVKSVDLAKREVTLHASGDRTETMRAGPEVKNLERLQRGDRIDIRFRAGLVLRALAAGADGVATDVEKDVKGEALGDQLGGTETVRARMVLTVSTVDPSSRVVVLKDAKGFSYQVKADPAIALDTIKEGDRFNATWSAAMAVSMEPTYRE